jgi:succinate-semialdehyde dehydrogenase/glutarate-semialdehyde dehydrogenase
MSVWVQQVGIDMLFDTLKDPSLIKAQCLIDGDWVDADSGQTSPVINPADGSEIARVAYAGASETQRAIAAADRAWLTWREETAEYRGHLLRQWYELMLAHQDDLAFILTAEQGKPLAEARAEIGYAASYVAWYAEEGKRVYGETVPSPWGDKKIIVTRESLGVCAAITPWNFPAAMITRKVAPALAAGCTMLVKPAPQTPLTALAMAELAQRAGIPPGVLSVITGDAVGIGGSLTSSPLVKKLTFTGSTATGRLLAAQCAPTLKKMSLELGGNAPFIVFDDADLDEAVVGAMASKFRNMGQTCVCSNRFLVQDSVYDAFAAKLKKAMSELKLGSGLVADTTQGPLIDSAALGKVQRLVADAVDKGAKVLTGGQPSGLGGTYYEPTLLGDVQPNMQIAQEEVFGPVAPLFRFETEAQAVAMANDTEFGLAAYFYSRDIGRVWRVSGRLQYGMVGINSGVISTAVAPFGGVKQSGQGREGGHQGIEAYLDSKYLCMGGLGPI